MTPFPGQATLRTQVPSRDNHPVFGLPFYVLPWIVPALTSLYLKYVMMVGTSANGGGGFKIAASTLGKLHGYTFWEKLSFFQLDIVVLVTTPVILIAVARFLPPRWRFPFVGLFSAGVTLALLVQLRAFQEVGQFLTFRMFLSAVTWGIHEPGAYTGYLGIKGALIFAAIAFVFWRLLMGSQRLRRPSESSEEHGRTRLAGLFLVFIVLVSIAGWLPLLGSTPYHSSVLLEGLRAYWHEDAVQTAEFVGLDNSVLLSRYQKMTRAPIAEGRPTYWAKEKGDNVLFFIFETMPARFLPPGGAMDDLPNLRTLSERSFEGLNHYTTFPRTHESIFSILSSWYPSDVNRTFEEQHPDLKVPGMLRSLSAEGYYTAIYSPMRRLGALEEEMFRELGVQHQIYPPDSFLPPSGHLRDAYAWQQNRIARDLATLDLMKQDLRQCLAQNQRFAAVFLPQIGHIPYPDVPQIYGKTDLPSQARGILQVQDAWLGELLRLLDNYHQLGKTIIVILGDHGIRTSEEDPGITGLIDEYSFHVPLFIYAPQAVHQTVSIRWLTSHIDVAPTVLDLLGLEKGREFEQGAPIWTAELADRQTYFFANTLFGTRGYYSNGRFYMRNEMSDTVYESLTPHFLTNDIIPRDSPQHEEVSVALARIIGLQQVVAAHFSQSKSIRNHVFGVGSSTDR